MIELFIKGLIIGILVSAPMGPVGILCVQRSLSKGHWHGFVSGLGAALSDTIYAAVTGLFMGLVVSFIESHFRILELTGGIVLSLYGIYLIRSNPVRIMRKRNEGKTSFFHDFVTAFFFTLSNVLIVFLYIGLFAHFSFVLSKHLWWYMIQGLGGIALGAVLWWFLITFLISRMRRWFNIRAIYIFNRIVGTIILVLVVSRLIYSYSGWFG
jgi:threonine/homoserine/homoserine lactone efflux protein